MQIVGQIEKMEEQLYEIAQPLFLCRNAGLLLLGFLIFREIIGFWIFL